MLGTYSLHINLFSERNKTELNYYLLYHLQLYKVGKYDKSEVLNLVLAVS